MTSFDIKNMLREIILKNNLQLILLYVNPLCKIHLLFQLGRFGLVVTVFVRCLLSYVVPVLCYFFPTPLIGPLIVAGSTRQQTVGRINQVADHGDEDEDEDKDDDEIPSYAVLLTASVKRFSVSRMRDFFCHQKGWC